MAFTTKPRGPHANFYVPCECGGEITVTSGRLDPHRCQPATSPEWSSAMQDYYDCGANGLPPKHPLDDRKS